jgi:perosamine synthetase
MSIVKPGADVMDDLPAILGGPPAFPDDPPPWPPAWPEVTAALAAAAADGSWGRYHGPHVAALEQELAAWFGVPHALTCASGTLAVEAALRAAGVGPGDEVILAAYEYEANFLSVHAIGAKPVLVDVSPRNWNLAPGNLAAAVGPATKAVVCTHLHGGLVPMPDVMAVAAQYGLAVVEDAAQATGAMIRGRKAGTWGHVGTLSFGGSKLLTAGRGGALVFADGRLFQRARVWLSRGVQQWAALSELQAAALRPQLPQLDHATAVRWMNVVGRFDSLFAEAKSVGLRRFRNPPEDTDNRAAFYKLGFRYDPAAFGLPRDLFVRAMRAEGIAFDAGFKPLHSGRSPSRFRAVGELPEATKAGERCVKLHHPVLLDFEAVGRVVRAVRTVYRNADRIAAAFPPS